MAVAWRTLETTSFAAGRPLVDTPRETADRAGMIIFRACRQVPSRTTSRLGATWPWGAGKPG